MNAEEGAAAKPREAEISPTPEGEAPDDSMRQLVTLAIMAVAIVVFLALCLPWYIL